MGLIETLVEVRTALARLQIEGLGVLEAGEFAAMLCLAIQYSQPTNGRVTGQRCCNLGFRV